MGRGWLIGISEGQCLFISSHRVNWEGLNLA